MLTEGADFVKHTSSFGGLRTTKVLIHLHLSLDGNNLEWRGAEDSSKNKGFIVILSLKYCHKEDDHIVLLDYNMKKQLVLEAQSAEQNTEWIKALKSIIADSVGKKEEISAENEIEAQAQVAQRDLANKQKRMKQNIEKKKKDAEKKKKKLGNVGMKHTAEAMMRGSSTPAPSSA